MSDQQTMGILLVDKPSGPSSFDVLRQLRGKFREKKMGYLGTLDPLASGLLVVFLGMATKLIPYFSEPDKEYIVDLEFGKISDTYDSTGLIQIRQSNKDRLPDRKDFEKIMCEFLGKQWQIQPAFSAIRYQGKRAYDLARSGKNLQLGKRQVTISDLELLRLKAPYARIRIRCSSGTYVRSFVHELGLRLNLGAIMIQLRRTFVGSFSLEHSKKLCEICEKDLISPQKLFDEGHVGLPLSPREKAFILKKLQMT